MQIKEGEAHPIGRGIQREIHKLGIAMNHEHLTRKRPFILLNLSHTEGKGGRAKQKNRFINCRNVL